MIWSFNIFGVETQILDGSLEDESDVHESKKLWFSAFHQWLIKMERWTVKCHGNLLRLGLCHAIYIRVKTKVQYYWEDVLAY